MKMLAAKLIILSSILVALPANAVSYRSITTYSNKAKKCEEKYIKEENLFLHIKIWWADVKRVTTKHKNDGEYIKSFIVFSKEYCKTLKNYREALDSGVDEHTIKTHMINFVHFVNKIRIENDIYH